MVEFTFGWVRDLVGLELGWVVMWAGILVGLEIPFCWRLEIDIPFIGL